MDNNDTEAALGAVRREYEEGRGPLIKFRSQNKKLIELAKNNPELFRYLGSPDGGNSV